MNHACCRMLLAAMIATTLLVDGCALRKLRKDVERIEEFGFIGGHVTRPHDDDAPIVVALSTTQPDKVVDSFVLERSGAYFFAVPPGTYQIVAFVDRNRNFTYEPEELAASYGEPTDVRVDAGQTIKGLDVSIGSESHLRPSVPLAVPALGKRGTQLPPVSLGEVVSLDDPRFTADNGNLGLWQPVEFLFEVGAGFYFLEPFDPHKIPVLFVHGAGGTPTDWRYLIAHLDRSKFQPWVLYYPSGIDLDVTARGAARWLNTLTVRYGFQRIAIVAHSMGGLVSRATINGLVANGSGDLVAEFISISSPWNGYAAAAAGAEHSPVVMPMWTDMAPGSPFLSELFGTPLPCPYYLLFSYDGHSLLLREPNDGTVALSSELAQPAQHAAKKVYGFKESHFSILSSAEVSATVNALLAGPAP